MNNDAIYFGVQLFVLLLIWIIVVVVVKILDKKDYYNDIEDYEISPQNKILFCKLRKQYLNNCSDKDIKDLQIFLIKYQKERKSKNENKK